MRRRSYRKIGLVGLVGAALALTAPASSAGGSCDSIASEPLHYDVVFERDVQPYFGGAGASVEFCDGCHTSISLGDLSLAPANVRANLLGPDELGMPSANYPEYLRVVPGRPLDSLVFVRAHCDLSSPSRMPPGGVDASEQAEFLRFQALLHDWIALGAIMADTDRRFVGDFETLR